MDMEVAKMFQEKNKDILKNSLALEMERNLESLKKTTDNCTALEMNKILLFFRDFFEEYKIIYNEDQIKDMIEKEKEILNNIVNSKIEQKKQNLHLFFEETKSEDFITEEYFEKYYEELSKNTKELLNLIEVELKKEICIQFTPSILAKYKLDTQEQQERLSSRINSLFTENLIRRIKEQFEFRDESLKNMCIESFERYIKLNESTVEAKTQ